MEEVEEKMLYILVVLSFLIHIWIFLKVIPTCLNVKRMASNFLCSKTSMRSWIFWFPLSSSSFLFISFSFCSEKETYWSNAFLFTWEYFFSSWLLFSSCLNSCFWDIFLYLSKASEGRDPNSRIFFVHSSIFCWRTVCLLAIFSNSLLSSSILSWISRSRNLRNTCLNVYQ